MDILRQRATTNSIHRPHSTTKTAVAPTPPNSTPSIRSEEKQKSTPTTEKVASTSKPVLGKRRALPLTTRALRDPALASLPSIPTLYLAYQLGEEGTAGNFCYAVSVGPNHPLNMGDLAPIPRSAKDGKPVSARRFVAEAALLLLEYLHSIGLRKRRFRLCTTVAPFIKAIRLFRAPATPHSPPAATAPPSRPDSKLAPMLRRIAAAEARFHLRLLTKLPENQVDRKAVADAARLARTVAQLGPLRAGRPILLKQEPKEEPKDPHIKTE